MNTLIDEPIAIFPPSLKELPVNLSKSYGFPLIGNLLLSNLDHA